MKRLTIDKKHGQTDWDLLKAAIQKILKKDNTGFCFEDSYRNAYTMVLTKHGDDLYSGLRVLVSEHLVKNVRRDVLDSLNSNFLETLNRVWNDYAKSLRMITDILMYVDRVYVQQNNVQSVYSLGLVLFKEKVARYGSIRDRLRSTLLEMVAVERRGEVVDRQAIKTACQMLMAVGNGTREIYEDFENPFLEQFADFCRSESPRLLAGNDASSFVRKIEQRLAEERESATHYLDPSTEKKIVKVMEQELISKNMDIIVNMEKSGLVHMLTNDKVTDLHCMYKLLKRVNDGLKTMTSALSAHLRSLGTSLVLEAEGDSHKNPVQLVQDLLDLKDWYDHLLAETFEDDDLFHQTIATDFEYFLNLNPKFPEYLSLFIDDKLKKGVKDITEAEIEIVLEKTMFLFRHLQDKDVFERYYKQHLVKRLLQDGSVSGGAEKSMSTKLKTKCGCPLTNKLDGMFKDMAVSNMLMEEYKEYCGNQGSAAPDLDIFVHVLTAGIWPIQAAIPFCILSKSVNNAFLKFQGFYMSKYSGRKIRLQPQLGSADLIAYFYGPELSNGFGPDGPSDENPRSNQTLTGQARKHILSVSTCQMCILMLFNSRERLTYEEIQAETEIPAKDLKPALQSLTIGQPEQPVLTRNAMVDPKGRQAKEIMEMDEFWVNDCFTSNSHRMNIQPISAKGESEPERQETWNWIVEDRKHEIDAVIVRVMKSRKRLSHAQLVSEVTTQLQSRFSPNPIAIAIKERIEGLIEREYLSSQGQGLYSYVA